MDTSLSNHVWEDLTCLQPTWCIHCSSLLFGFHKQGQKCKSCASVVHHACSAAYNSKVSCNHSCGKHQLVDKTFHHVVHCRSCSSCIMGVGKLCIHCRAPACNQKCAEDLMDSVCKSTEAPARYMCPICTLKQCAHFANAKEVDSNEFGSIWQLSEEPEIKCCSDPQSCSCICTLGNFHDVAQKTASIIGGVGLLVGSVAATALTAGAAAPILVPVLVASGIGGGIGVASATHGIAQSVKKERINGRDYGIDLGIGGITGLVGTAAVAGAAATGAAAGAALVAHGATTAAVYTVEGATLATAGAVSGVTGHLVSDGIDIATGRKDEMDFGQNVAVSALTGGVTGAIGAATTQINVAVTKGVADDVASAAASFAIKGTGKFAEATIKAGTNKALMDEEMEAHDILSTAITGVVSTGVGCAGSKIGGPARPATGPKTK